MTRENHKFISRRKGNVEKQIKILEGKNKEMTQEWERKYQEKHGKTYEHDMKHASSRRIKKCNKEIKECEKERNLHKAKYDELIQKMINENRKFEGWLSAFRDDS